MKTTQNPFAVQRLLNILLLGITLVWLLSAVSAFAAGTKIPKLNGKPDFSGIWQSLSAADYDLEPHSNRKDAPPSEGIHGWH